MKLLSNPEFKRWFSSFLLILAGIICFATISNFAVIAETISGFLRILSPFVAGFIIAYLLNIPCNAIERSISAVPHTYIRRFARGISVMLTIIGTIALVVITLVIVVPEVVANSQDFLVQLPLFINNWVLYWQDTMGDDSIINMLGLHAFLNEFTVIQIFDFIGYDSIWAFFVGVFGAATFMVNATIAIISAIYIMLEASRMKAFFIWTVNSFVPYKTSSVFFRHLSNAHQNLQTFIYCMVVDSMIMSTITLVALTIMRVDFAVVLAINIGITNLVPYFGSLVGSIIVILIVLLTEDIGTAIAASMFIIILQQIDAHVIKVKLFGDSFNMSPFLVIFSITIGGAYYGIAGMVLAIPLTAMLRNIFIDIIEHRRQANIMDNRRHL